MKIYEPLQELSACTGCAACQNVCPSNAIEMKVHLTDGYKPSFCEEKCINCGRCTQICPALNQKSRVEAQPDTYAVWAEEEIRAKSSSGGVFSVLAEHILNNGGTVYGAAWEKGWEVRHIRIDTKEELHRLRKSKYVQSNTSNVYRNVWEDLADNRKVLFVGVPCQIAGLKAYIGDHDKLFTVDLICEYAPSPALFEKYLKENYEVEQLSDIIHRNSPGWRVEGRYEYKDGACKSADIKKDSYYRAFLSRLLSRNSCDDCQFDGLSREGDLTIGDFWGIEEYDKTWNDSKGTSCLLVNSPKGQSLFEQVKERFVRLEQVESKWFEKNGGLNKFQHKYRKEFQAWLEQGDSFNNACEKAFKKKWDIGLFGIWAYCNYGSRLNAWSLYNVLKGMGYSVLMIAPPISSKIYKESPHILEDKRFYSLPYDKADLADIPFDVQDCVRFNSLCDCFMVGSDQNFTKSFYTKNSKTASLNWVKSNKGKVGYGISFGQPEFWGDENERLEMEYFFKKFVAVSVREKDAVELMHRNFEIESEFVLDPVFLCEKKEYLKLAEKGKARIPREDYLLTYILKRPEQDLEFKQILENCKKQLGINKIIIVPDPIFNKTVDGECITDVKVEEWLALLLNAKYIVTNSFHGVCFSIIFHKPFVVINDIERGAARLVSILNLFHITERMVYKNNRNRIQELLLRPIDWYVIDEICEEMKGKSLSWLSMAMKQAKDKKGNLDSYDILFEKLISMEEQIKILTQTREGKRMIKDKFELYQKPLYTEADMSNPYTRRLTNNFDFMSKWFYLNKNNRSVAEELRRRGYQKIAIYGAARIGQLLYDELSNSDEIEVVYIMDQSVKKLADREVYQGITDEPIDAVVVTAINYFVDVKRKLHGYTRKDIVSLEEVVSYLYDALVENEFNIEYKIIENK